MRSHLLSSTFFALGGLLVVVVLWGIVAGASVPKAEAIQPRAQIAQPQDSMIQEHNRFRISHDLPILFVNDQLMQSAQMKAEDLCESKVFQHNDSSGRSFTGFIRDAGYPKKVHTGENLARGYLTTSEAFKALVASPTHYANIVESYNEIGVGFSACEGVNYMAIHYGTAKVLQWKNAD